MSLTSLSWTIGALVVVSVPLALSILALLDAARRPSWVWAFAGRSQVAWMLAIMFGVLLVPIGLVVSVWYLRRLRPVLAAIESGQLGD